ncbi:predicted ORF [Xanthomonas phage XacN1]|nr:predicted ORF [Xanthomonas phage XacN1]
MKIQNILSEDFQAQVAATPAPKIKFSDLDTLQVRVLQKLADGSLDVDTAKDSEYDIMADLAELGLLDQDYQLTKAGQKAVAIAQKLGGSAELLAARKKQQSMDTFDRGGAPALDVEVDDTVDDDALPADDEVEDEDEFDFNLGQRGRTEF